MKDTPKVDLIDRSGVIRVNENEKLNRAVHVAGVINLQWAYTTDQEWALFTLLSLQKLQHPSHGRQ